MTDLLISKLKTLIIDRNIDLYLIPTRDRYLGEEIPAYYNRLNFITGLHCSNAILAVGEKSALFTDGRYITQAQEALRSLPVEIINESKKPLHSWCKENLPVDSTIGFDPELFSIRYIEKLNKDLEGFCKLEPITPNLVDLLWQNNQRPSAHKIYDHPIELVGQEALDKISNLDKELLHTKTSHLIICNPQTICWLLNIRGDYLSHTPLIAAYLVHNIESGDICLFTDTEEVHNESSKNWITIYPMSKFQEYLSNLKDISFSLDDKQTPYHVKMFISNQHYQHLDNPCIKNMSVKNSTEVSGAINAHIYDAVAMCKFLCWLENKQKTEKLSEVDVCKKIWEFRKASGCITPSFMTIAGFNSNGAMIHYSPESMNSTTIIDGDGILLLDSGGQYKEGTTDVTRTIAIGNPTLEQKEIYTAVLKGHIALARAKFPVGTTGHQLDILARKPIWKMGLNYEHGTGHGVGSFSSVHEGLQSISTYPNPHVLLANMLITNEPGCYLPGKFGIRIENVLLVEEASHKNFLKFRTLTLVSYDQKLIDFTAFDDEEISWINSYHQQICDIILPLLDSEEERAWLEKATEAYV